MPSKGRREPLPTLELDIENLALGGKGVAHYEGRVVLVEGGFPGDRVRARVYKRRRNLYEAHADEILIPSPMREPARCSHVGICGGCKLQGFSYPEQLKAKTSQIEESLRRLGGVEHPPMQPAIPAPDIYEYRNKMEFSFAVDKDSGDLVCGMHYAGRFDRVFDLHECHLVPPTFGRIVVATREFLKSKQVPAYHAREHTGHARYLVVRRSEFSGELLVNYVTTSAEYTLRDDFVSMLREAVPEITGILRTVHDGRSQTAVEGKTEVWYGRAGMTEQMGVLRFDLSPLSFFQTNSKQAVVLYDLMLKIARPTGDEVALDLYCGTGTIGLYLAPHVKSVRGVEQLSEAVDMAIENARHNQIDNAEFICADVMKWLKESSDSLHESNDPLLVVIDPPRSGLHPKVPALLLAARPCRIVYVSCNPATLARDVALFREGGYLLESVTPIDMFPHTAHIECVSLLVPED